MSGDMSGDTNPRPVSILVATETELDEIVKKMNEIVKKRILRKRGELRADLKRLRHRKKGIEVPSRAKPPWSKEGWHPEHQGGLSP